ncbi:MAG TPA: class I SAM-dependent methyltransferase [Terriglobales bacterium]|jgi:ubiquinone/menaquinone biosynthesis C-methylase UbiE
MQLQDQIASPGVDRPSLASSAAVASLPAEITTIDCDLIAPWYEPVEHLCFGGALERRRNAFLGDLGSVHRALSCGEGDGRFTAALLRSNTQVEVTAVDASQKMLEVATRRVASMGSDLRDRVDYRCGKIHNFIPPRTPFDLIATHFFLDCFSTDEARAVIHRIAGWAARRTQWIVSEFCQPPTPVGQLWTGVIIRSLYAAFRVTTGLQVTRLPDYRPALQAEGFELRKQEYALGGLLVSELWKRV